MTKALICVDIQRDFCEGGNLAVEGGNAVAAAVAKLVPTYDVVAFTRDWHINPAGHFALGGAAPDFDTTWPVHCVAGTAGAEMHTELVPVMWGSLNGTLFSKGATSAAYSGFEGVNSYEVGLEVWLRAQGATEVDVVGLALDYCVKATALDAAAAGFDTRVLVDYTAAVNPTAVPNITNAMQTRGVEVVTGV